MKNMTCFFFLGIFAPAAVLAQAPQGNAPRQAAATMFIDGGSTGLVTLDVASPAACAALATVVQQGQADVVCVEPTQGWSVRNPDPDDYPAPVERPQGGIVYRPVMLIDGGEYGGFQLYEFDGYEGCLQAGPNMGRSFVSVYCLDLNDGRAQRFQ